MPKPTDVGELVQQKTRAKRQYNVIEWILIRRRMTILRFFYFADDFCFRGSKVF